VSEEANKAARDASIVGRVRAGEPLADIARSLGLCASTVSKIATDNGCPRRKIQRQLHAVEEAAYAARQRALAAKQETMLDDYKAGIPLKQIAHKYGVSISYPVHLARRRGVATRMEAAR
jgi:predicted transcriptional regulator